MSKTKQVSYVAVIQQDSAGPYTAYFPDFDGCITQGQTLEEVRKAAASALKLYIKHVINPSEESSLPEPNFMADEEELDEKSHCRITLNLDDIIN